MQVDGVRNPKVQSVFFEDMPVHRASFANDGAQVSHGHWHSVVVALSRLLKDTHNTLGLTAFCHSVGEGDC